MEVADGDNAAAGRGHEGGRVTSDGDRSPCRRRTAGNRREHEPATAGDSVLPARTERGGEAPAGGGGREQPGRKDGHVVAAGAGDVVAAGWPGEKMRRWREGGRART